MNNRKKYKEYKKFKGAYVGSRQSCIYCINWGMGCANGHPNVYPGDKSDYFIFCKGIMDAQKYLAKRLKEEGYSLSGWRFFESPVENVYIFYNEKKHKEITVFYEPEKSEYQIASTDMYWKFSDEHNVYIHETVEETLSAPWQHWNFVYTKLGKDNKKMRRKALKKFWLRTYPESRFYEIERINCDV